MASIVRPTLMKQSCFAAASKRALTTKTTNLAPVFSKPAPSALSQQSIRSAFQRDIAARAGFHASTRQQILPPGPQVIEGTANDATPVPKSDPTHGSYHWTFERLISVALVPLTIAPFASGSLNPATDAILCSAILIHSHMGFQACVIDYFPKRRVPKTRKGFEWLLNGATLAVAFGLYEFETNDVGVTEAIKRIWEA